jgi:hypothetical protein
LRLADDACRHTALIYVLSYPAETEVPSFRPRMKCGPFSNMTGSGSLVSGAVPEPSTWALMLIGFAGIGFVTCRRTKTNTTALAAA